MRIRLVKGHNSGFRKGDVDMANGSKGSPKVPVQVSHRDSGTGQFVTKKYADNHPTTTERERIKRPDW